MQTLLILFYIFLLFCCCCYCCYRVSATRCFLLLGGPFSYTNKTNAACQTETHWQMTETVTTKQRECCERTRTTTRAAQAQSSWERLFSMLCVWLCVCVLVVVGYVILGYVCMRAVWESVQCTCKWVASSVFLCWCVGLPLLSWELYACECVCVCDVDVKRSTQRTQWKNWRDGNSGGDNDDARKYLIKTKKSI